MSKIQIDRSNINTMRKSKRRVLTPNEKKQLLKKYPNCYICESSLKGYENNEIQFDHIYNYADGHEQNLENFAPVHASKKNRKKNCHKEKGQKSPIIYKEEVRIKDLLQKIKGLGDICRNAHPSTYEINKNKSTIEFNGKTLPLYNQKINGLDNYYFYDEIDTKYIENDEQIQLRPLGPNILPLIFNLKNSIQLLPSIGRLDANSETIKIFDGQHKAVAQIVGNNRKYILCIVFINTEIKTLQEVIFQAHSTFAQQKYNRNHIESKLASIYKKNIEAYRKRIGNPNAPFTEFEILQNETKARRKEFILSFIIEEVKTKTNFIDELVATTKKEQKIKPMIWQSLEKLISSICNLEPVDEPSDSPTNFRNNEISNVAFIVDQIKLHAIDNKWNPENPESKPHKLSRTFFYKMSFNNWSVILVKALEYCYEIKKDEIIRSGLCYTPEFDLNIKKKFERIIKKLFDHPMWLKDINQSIIAKANVETPVTEIFDNEKLNHLYLSKN